MLFTTSTFLFSFPLSAASLRFEFDVTMAEENPSGGQQQTADEDDRKLFVGGLPQEVSEEELNEHFGQFGEIESVNLKTDPNTGRSRGFCFVVYKVRSCYDSIHFTCIRMIQNKSSDFSRKCSKIWPF